MVGDSAATYETKKLPKPKRLISLVVAVSCLVIAGAIVFVFMHHSKTSQANQEINLSNAAFSRGNKTEALIYAKKALADQPNKISNIMLVANLTNTESPSEARQYYIQALNKFKQQNNIGSTGTTAVSYWAAATMAERANETGQAEQYFKDVIKTSSSSNSYEQTLAKQSQVELESLQ
jgi:tetratricopeptide (TPR) repeat protein